MYIYYLLIDKKKYWIIVLVRFKTKPNKIVKHEPVGVYKEHGLVNFGLISVGLVWFGFFARP